MKISSGKAMITHLATALVGAVLAAGALGACHPSWQQEPVPLHSGVQPADPPLQSGKQDLGSARVLDGLAGCFVEGVPLANECLERAPRCPYEDGDPSGWPCLWINPRTHLVYYVSSREYWD